MNICYVAVDIALPAPTGGSTHTLEMARALSEQGNSVYIVSRREKRQLKRTVLHTINIQRIYRLILFPGPLEKKGMIHRDKSNDGFLTRLYYLYLKTVFALYAGIEVARVVRKHNVQLVLERATSLGAGAIAAKLTHRPLVVEVITAWLAPISLRNARRILTYSIDMMPEWVERSKIVKVTAAVNTRLFNPMVNQKKIRKKYAFGDKPVIAYSGGFLEYHGVDTIIEASKEVIARHPQSIFLMIGPNYHTYESYARSLGVADHFVFTGSIPYEEVPDFLASADILLAPYFPKKGMGEWLWRFPSTGTLKLLEYLALQKPVITSKLPPTENFIKDGETGILVPAGNPEALGREINKLLEDPGLAQRIAKQGHELIKEEHTWDNLARAVQECGCHS